MTSIKTIVAATVILFAASAQAADSRQQFISGNPDSDNSRDFYVGMTAVQPGIGADFDRYQGFGEGNPDLFSEGFGPSPEHQSPDIYGAFGGSPDLSY